MTENHSTTGKSMLRVQNFPRNHRGETIGMEFISGSEVRWMGEIKNNPIPRAILAYRLRMMAFTA